MDLAVVRTFFMWCTIINAVLLMVTTLTFLCAADWIYRMHSRWFPLSREAFDVAIYALVGLYKTLFIVFNIVPFIALLIMRS